MFYGVMQEDYILQEIDFKGAISTVKKKIKNAILSFIRKIESFLSKGKDNKIKSALRSLLQKVRKLLGDTENIETESDAKKVNKEIEKCREEYNKITEWEAPGIVTEELLYDWFKEKTALLNNPSKYYGVIVSKYGLDENKLSDKQEDMFERLNMHGDDICLIICEKKNTTKFIFKKNIIIEYDKDGRACIETNLGMKLIEHDGFIVLAL